MHKQKYEMAKKRIDEALQDAEEINTIRDKFKANKIQVIKYNCSLDENVQNFQSYEGFMQLVDNELIITNKKPLDNPKYTHTEPMETDQNQNETSAQESKGGYEDEEELSN